MVTVISGLGLLLVTLAAFSLFSMKAPKGTEAMSGMANAAVATFLVEAVHRYISGDLFGIEFLGQTEMFPEVWEVLRLQLWYRFRWESIRSMR